MDNLDYTPLHRASNKGQLSVVIELLGDGAEIEAKDSDDWTSLHFACCHGHLAVVIELLSPEDEIRSSDSNGAITSIFDKRKSRRAANIEAKTNQGDTPLHCASENGQLAVVKALVSGGADILVADLQGDLPIHLAVRFGRSEVSKYLFQQVYATIRRLPLHELVEHLTWISRAALDEDVFGTGDVVEILKYLFGQNPALLSSRDQDGSLPLHVACRRGTSFTIVQSLVNHYQASVKSATSEGD
jgi:ankyrin repeat protein